LKLGALGIRVGSIAYIQTQDHHRFMEVPEMRRFPADWVVLACFVLAAFLVCSCSDDTTCPICPKPCVNPADALLGTWTIFEAFMNGSADPSTVGAELEFRDDDTLTMCQGSNCQPALWLADSNDIIITDPSSRMSMPFRYEFEADTLNMSASNGSFDVLWRLPRK
jgi:hypothetical protein